MNYYISPRFLDKLAVHITKNFLHLPNLSVPLILGIHGRKGEGKSFQCELVFKLMGIEPVRMSAGELESPDAGDPVRLIRTRYREASDLIKVRGKMCVLLINDIDAGAGRVDSTTQYTVNTQLVNGTLMNIADNPTDVQLPGSYETEPINRVPILLTGNDFSTLYAPLLRDGRMDKFYWEPSQEDRSGIVTGIFQADGLTERNVEELISNFPNQSIDFFGALRSQVYDQQIRDFIREIGINRVSTHIVNNPDLSIKFQQSPNFGLPYLIKLGKMMEQEQQRVQSRSLVEEYTTGKVSKKVDYVPVNSEPISFLNSANSSKPELTGVISSDLSSIERLLENGLRHGGRLSLEIATPREKAQNSWRSWQWQHQPQNVSDAMEQVQQCVQDHPKSFIRLVGYNPKTQIRVLQEVIIRP
jgi:ribulose bisphosphate carboxylase small subunit